MVHHLLLMNKAFKGLRRYIRTTTLPSIMEAEEVVMRHRAKIVLRAMMKVCFNVLPRQRMKYQRADFKYARSL